MQFQPWELAAGLGIFLFGMMTLEQALHRLGTHSFRRLLREHTNTPIRGVLMGIISTVCLQSSSMVGLIVLAFVGAGILKMTNALGIIFGANLGTTFTGWVVATIGFKFNLTEYSLPLLALGTLGTVFIHTEHRRHPQAKLLLGLGLLLMGLGLIKTSMEGFSEQLSPELFRDYPLPLFLLGGLIFTAIIQSSSATMMIVLSAIHTDVLPLTTAAAIIIGADLGTTGTILISSLKGTADKRRVALSHFIFNLVNCTIAFFLLPVILHLITNTLSIQDPMYALVLFHSMFNLMGIALFLPFISPFSRWLQNRFTNGDTSGCQYITKVSYKVGDAADSAIYQEVTRLFYKVIILNLRVMKIRPEELFKGYKALDVYQQTRQERPSFDEQYSEIKHTEQEVLYYANKVLQEKPGKGEAESIPRLLDAARNLAYSAKSLKDVRQNFVELRLQSDDEELIETIHHDTRAIYRHLLNLLEKTDPVLITEKHEEIKSETNLSHDQLHQLIIRYVGSEDIGIPLSSLLNINRGMLVSNQMLANAVGNLTPIDKED
ncbi:MAG: Na/Pi symporter [Porticoccus sp.]|nr:Na/Pi symporter [Porticoccus sp.]